MKELIRIVLFNKKIHIYKYNVKKIKEKTKRIISDVPECVYQGLKFSRLRQFNKTSDDSYVLITIQKYFYQDLAFFKKKCCKILDRISMDKEINMKKVEPIHTSCHDCIWGTYDDQGATTQRDCGLQLLDHYRNKKTEILEAYNEKGEFFIVNGRKCYFKRDKGWWTKIHEKKIDHVEEVFKETKIKYMAIIDGKDDFLDIKLTLNSLLNDKLPPSYLVVIRKFGSIIDVKKLNKILIDTGKKWRVSTPSSPEITSQFILNGLVDMFAEKYPIYLFIDAGHVLFNNEMEKLNNEIIYNDYRFGLIPINGIDDKIGNSIVHKFYRGEFPQECIMSSIA